MKKITVVLLVAGMIFALFSCAKPSDDSVPPTDTTSTENNTSDTSQEVIIPIEWPDNELTQFVPKPDFALTGSNLDNVYGKIVLEFKGATFEQIKEYDKTLADAGYKRESLTELDNLWAIYRIKNVEYGDVHIALFWSPKTPPDLSVQYYLMICPECDTRLSLDGFCENCGVQRRQ